MISWFTYVCYNYVYNEFVHVNFYMYTYNYISGTFKCSITSTKLMANTFEISCELLKTLRRIRATITCTKCQPITIIGDSPIIVSNLIAEQYTVEMAIADSIEINDTIVEIISVSDNDKPVNSTIVDILTTSTSTVPMSVTPTNVHVPVNEGAYVYVAIYM